jgi:signal transduction histidine kinase
MRGHSNPLPPHDQEDLIMANDLAQRAAFTIDNAFLYQEAQDAVRARDEFLSIASHELKTPLTSLKLQTQLLMRTFQISSKGQTMGLIEEKFSKMLKVTDRQLERLSKLIEDLLDVSQINCGRLKLNLEQFDLVDLVKDILERFGPQLKGIPCGLNVPNDYVIIGHWDRFRLDQVVTNLITNAIKYGDGKPIDIGLSMDGEKTQLVVKDQGIGIAKENQTRIFERFERVMNSQHVSGLGLGLYIVNQILEAHQGKISIQSQPNYGTTFTVHLPLGPMQ